MRSRPRWSIVVPTHGRPRLLAECVRSLLDLDSVDGGFEIVVVDDGTEPPIALDADPEQVRLIRQRNAGPGPARNRGVAEARGDLIAFIDDDCVPRRDWLVQLNEALKFDESLLVGGAVINALEDNIWSSASQDLLVFVYGYFARHAPSQSFFTSNNLACHRSTFQRVGGFSERLLGAGEDRELCERWQETGVLVEQPSAVVEHWHDLSFRRFLRQHIWYGRSAAALHTLRRARGGSNAGSAPQSFHFYRQLLLWPFTTDGKLSGRSILDLRRWRSSLLLSLSQLAYAAGALQGWWRGRRSAVEAEA